MINHYRCHPEVLILDYTYKTNKYNLPLLNIVLKKSLHFSSFLDLHW
jgi:hypothetical protein